MLLWCWRFPWDITTHIRPDCVGVLNTSQAGPDLFAQLQPVRLNNNGANLLLTGECFDVTALIFWMALYFIILTRLLIIINKYGSQFVKILTIYYVLITACREERGWGLSDDVLAVLRAQQPLVAAGAVGVVVVVGERSRTVLGLGRDNIWYRLAIIWYGNWQGAGEGGDLEIGILFLVFRQNIYISHLADQGLRQGLWSDQIHVRVDVDSVVGEDLLRGLEL